MEDSRPQAILKFHRLSSLDYRVLHELPVKNEKLCILVTQGASKLAEVNFGDSLQNLGVKSGRHVRGVDRLERQNFFLTSNFDRSQFCSPLSYDDE